MCEILAISANKPVGVSLSWSAFRHRGRYNPHGWGFAYETAGALKGRRFPTKLERHEQVPKVKSKAFLCHVRYKVDGSVATENTQPFVDEAHSWSISATMSSCRVKSRFRGRVVDKLKGQTGTEVLFWLLVRALHSTDDTETVLKKTISRTFATADLPKNACASFVLTDGRSLFAFRHRKPLYLVTRRPPHMGEIRLTDPGQPGYVVKLGTDKGSDEGATVLASEKLTNEDWLLLEDRTLMRITEGEVDGSWKVPN